MVWDPQKPKISLLDPPMDPILAHFVGKKADFGVKNRVFLKYVFSYKMTFGAVFGSPGTLSDPIGALSGS